MTLLMAADGVMADTAAIMTRTTNLLTHAKVMAITREKAVETSCEEYLACKFLLLSNGERYTPLRAHLEDGHAEGKKPYPITGEGMKTLMVDYKAQVVAAPRAAKKDEDNKSLPLPRHRSVPTRSRL